MDGKWRTFTCRICRGYGMIGNPEAWYGYDDCDNCNYGTVWIRPKGHAFQYPGGPACGMWGEEEYKKAIPVMPFDWHSWTQTESEIENFVIDRFGAFDEDLNTVTCSCGFEGSIKEHDIHAEQKEQEFISEHSPLVKR